MKPFNFEKAGFWAIYLFATCTMGLGLLIVRASTPDHTPHLIVFATASGLFLVCIIWGVLKMGKITFWRPSNEFLRIIAIQLLACLFFCWVSFKHLHSL